jgi:hypothetical protein
MPFDYSDQEWIKIENAVQRVRPGGLTSFEWRRIRTTAHLFHHEDRSSFVKKHHREHQKRWEMVARLSKELTDAIAAATAMHVKTPAVIVRTSRAVEQLRIHSLGWLKITTPFEHETNRQRFHRAILEIWTGLFDGKLSAPRNSAPLVEFFLAVANPVHKKPLVPSSIKKIVDQEKSRPKAEKSNG